MSSVIALGGSLIVFFIGSVRASEMRAIDSTEGQVLYKAQCAVCHGTDGKGGGPIARYLKVAPSNLTVLATRNGGRFPLSRVEKVISGEAELPAGHGSSLMPVWGPVFSNVAWDRDLGPVRIHNVAKYVEGLQR